LSIINSRFLGNQTNGPGEIVGEGTGGAISLDAVSQNEVTAYLNICGCEFRNNVALNTGGAVYLVGHWYTGTVVTIDQSLFEANRTTSANGGQGGAIFLMDDEKSDIAPDPARASRAAISNSLFVGNETLSRGGGVWYWTMDGRLTVTNVTFEGNQTTTSPEGMGGAIAISRGPADFVNSTLANNYAQFHGGGIQAGGDAVISLLNCLFYQNTSNRDGGWANFHTNREADVDHGGNMQYLSDDLVIDGNSDALVSANAVRADPLLQPLADNGGPTHTMALGDGSPAIDAGVAAGAPAIDQRGEARDSAPDIGAYEVQ
jgi:predicted outer membrane repeat protein